MDTKSAKKAFDRASAWLGVAAATTEFAVLNAIHPVINGSTDLLNVLDWKTTLASAVTGLLVCSGVGAVGKGIIAANSSPVPKADGPA